MTVTLALRKLLHCKRSKIYCAHPLFLCRPATSGRIHASVIGDVGTYLADAAKQVFSPSRSNAPPNWEGTGSGFSGKVTHHETARLRELYSMLRHARVGITGGTLAGVFAWKPLQAAARDTSTKDLCWLLLCLPESWEPRGPSALTLKSLDADFHPSMLEQSCLLTTRRLMQGCLDDRALIPR